MKIDHHKIKAKAVDYGKLGVRLTVQAGILYAALIVFGFAAGGIGGFWGAQHLGRGFFVSLLACLAGLAGGAVLGFYFAQMIVLGIIQDMLLSAGLHHGKVGLGAALKLLKEKREKQKLKAAAKSGTPEA